jgi:hypothetical protein
MSEESRRVLDMLSQGRITVSEADRLLAAIAPESRGSAATGSASIGATDTKKATATGEAPSPKFLRVTITKAKNWTGDDAEPSRRAWMWPGHTGGQTGGRNREVSVRVPLALVRNGMRIGAMIPGLTGAGVQARLRERGLDVDLSKIDADTIDQLVSQFGEMNIDIVSERGAKAQVRITTE